VANDLTPVRDELRLDSPEAGPKGAAASLHARSARLATSADQLAVLAAVGIPSEFEAALAGAGWPTLPVAALEIFQINLGKLCNMTCRHCHVDAGPDRVLENMDRATIDACLRALDQTEAHTVDITGGAPELNPHFRYLVDAVVERGRHVIDRCNLTVLTLPKFADLPRWMSERGVEVVCSLPHYRRLNTDAQRGDGTFDRSIDALRRLNAVGYGAGDPRRRLTLMHNPSGAYLPGAQPSMEREWKAGLAGNHGVSFDRLIALNNMPISRFLEWLLESGNLDAYMAKLTAAFNPGAVRGLMCRNTLSIGWDGALYDCDFNQMLELPVREGGNIRSFDNAALEGRTIVTGRHCFGCTAGAGSSCGGATA
jgi:radical SAM/Cys-rich protein